MLLVVSSKMFSQPLVASPLTYPLPFCYTFSWHFTADLFDDPSSKFWSHQQHQLGKSRLYFKSLISWTWSKTIKRHIWNYTTFLIIKPTKCTNFSNLFLEWKSTRLGQFLCPSSGVFHSTHSNGICHAGLLTACEQDQDRTAVPSWSCAQAVSKTIWHILLRCVQWKLLMMGRGTVQNM